MKKIKFKDTLSKNKNFKLLGFKVELTFGHNRDYQDLHFITEINEVHFYTDQIIKRNQKLGYKILSLYYTPIYEIINKEYYTLHNPNLLKYTPYFENGKDYFDGKKVLSATPFKVKIKNK